MQQQKDPADVWWGSAGGADQHPDQPPVAQVGDDAWGWRYSAWTGVMYGPIPVGILAVLSVWLLITLR